MNFLHKGGISHIGVAHLKKDMSKPKIKDMKETKERISNAYNEHIHRLSKTEYEKLQKKFLKLKRYEIQNNKKTSRI